MANKLKLVELIAEDGTSKALLNPYDFTSIIKDPIILYLTFNDEPKIHPSNKTYIQRNALNHLKTIPVGHLDSKINHFDFKERNLSQLKELLQTKGYLDRREEKEVSNLIDIYMNIAKNIERAKVERNHVPEAKKIVKKFSEDYSKVNNLNPFISAKVDYDTLNLELQKIYFSFGNPHAKNAR